MNRIGRVAVAAAVVCLFFVASIIVFTGAAPALGVPIGLVWVTCGHLAAGRVNHERSDCGRPEMPISTEQAFLYGGLLSVAALAAWKVLDIVVYGR